MTRLLAGLQRRDEHLLNLIVARRYSRLDSVMRVATRLADPLPAVVFILILCATPATRAAGLIGLFTLVVSHVWVQLLKRSFCRDRPTLPVGIASLAHAPDRFSFPSGHSAAAASMALTIAIAAPSLAIVALPAAILIGTSRCYLGVHYPGDVLMGWLLAWLAFLLAHLI